MHSSCIHFICKWLCSMTHRYRCAAECRLGRYDWNYFTRIPQQQQQQPHHNLKRWRSSQRTPFHNSYHHTHTHTRTLFTLMVVDGYICFCVIGIFMLSLCDVFVLCYWLHRKRTKIWYYQNDVAKQNRWVAFATHC